MLLTSLPVIMHGIVGKLNIIYFLKYYLNQKYLSPTILQLRIYINRLILYRTR